MFLIGFGGHGMRQAENRSQKVELRIARKRRSLAGGLEEENKIWHQFRIILNRKVFKAYI
jgi:hypothetical protein